MNSSIFRAFGTVGAWTMLSRILGFVRDMLMSRVLGAGFVADAFNVSFALPNLFRRFLAEGAMNTAFLPLYSEKLDEQEKADAFARNVFSAFLLTLMLLISVVQIFMPAVIMLLASGFIGDARFDMAESFSRITIFYILFMSISAFCGSMLNAHKKYAAAAAYPTILNIFFIPSLLVIRWLGIEGEEIGYWLSWTVFLAGLAQFLFIYGALRREKISLGLTRPKWNGELKTFLAVLAPALLTSGVGQINLLVGRQIASWTEGAVSWLYYADRLIQLPMGVIGIPVGSVLLSVISGTKSDADDAELKRYYNHAFLFSLFFSLPAATALIAISAPIVGVMFEGGAFKASDTSATAQAVMVYALSIPAMILYRADIQLFYARKNTKTPFNYALMSMFVNLVLAVGLYRWLGYMAAVIATTISAWVSFLLAHFGSRKFGDVVALSAQTKRIIFYLALIAVAMGGLCYGLSLLLAGWLSAPFLKWIALGMIVACALFFYFSLAMLAMRMKPRDLLRMMRRS